MFYLNAILFLLKLRNDFDIWGSVSKKSSRKPTPVQSGQNEVETEAPAEERNLESVASQVKSPKGKHSKDILNTSCF